MLSCNKDENLKKYDIVINDEIVETNIYDATISATYSYPSTIDIKLLYADNESLNDFHTINPDINDGVLIFAITGLEPQTEYFYQLEYSNGMMTSRTAVKNFTTNPAPEPPTPEIVVTTANISDITINSAKTGGSISCEEQVQIQNRGVCYSNNHKPTINDHVTSNGTGLGSFISVLTDLEANTKYYVRAYAQTNDSVVYGNEVNFTTNAIIAPEILTLPVTDISTTTATCGGNILSDGGYPIIARGVCWSTYQNPTTSDESTANGEGLGEYTAYLTDLQPETQYYVRAYAITSNDVYYGEQISFTTEMPVDVQSFSVSPTSKVLFSPGNLQYNSRLNLWKFAENQYDYCGDANQHISPNFSGYIDLFGWGTSGYNGCAPYLNTTNGADYAGNTDDNIEGTMYDWGLFITINNTQGEWRTLTIDEWTYLINSRENASRLRAKAVINGVKGFMLLPDNWVKPESINFVENAISWLDNNYNLTEWSILEESNAVFLPAGGNRNGSNVYDVNITGSYWSTTTGGNKAAMHLLYTESSYGVTISNRNFGRSVRLVKDL